MHTARVQMQTKGGITVAPCQDRAQKRIFNPQDWSICFCGNRFAARGGRGLASDTDQITVTGLAKFDVIA